MMIALSQEVGNALSGSNCLAGEPPKAPLHIHIHVGPVQVFGIGYLYTKQSAAVSDTGAIVEGNDTSLMRYRCSD